MDKSIAELKAYRASMNEKILNSGFKDYKKIFSIDHKAYLNGAVPARYKEMMGLVGSMVLRCNDCIFYHLDRCIEEGVTEDELKETMHIALVIGGSIVIPHLRFAFEMMEKLNEEKSKSIK
ncbi:MAG: carboxymuconolactone decarboxylase family protein [Deferribacteres bacterium]|nr:carboxymuconolactone decarboxylase family protein [candidate division KSB1 bacterium]MCB9501521.1 carboxymuconolactone decarboxylase family protein [Deferribacteres bacterium]